jgi:polyhydroxybutyrate depolymerase
MNSRKGIPRAAAGRVVPVVIVALLVAVGMSVTAVAAATASRSGKAMSKKQPCQISSRTGQRTIPLVDQGQSRPFLLRVPQGYDGRHYDGRHRVRLVLNLHLSGFNGAQQMAISQMGPVADRRGFAVAAPDGAVALGGSGYTWNIPGVPSPSFRPPVPAGTPNDEQYLMHVIRAAKRSLCINDKRIYVAGYSAGAQMASKMACDHAGKIAAIAPVSGLRAGVPKQTSSGGWQPDGKTCRPDQPVPILAFHGTADPLVPYAGDDDPGWGYGAETALARWAKINRCRRGRRSAAVTESVSVISYSKCEAHGAVRLYREDGAGHTWPGSTFPAIGPIDQTVNASALILRFFAEHPLRN